MPDTPSSIAGLAAESRRGYVVAAAGCGKTEEIAKATALGSAKRLILTHTHAGVDALTSRLERLRVPSKLYRIHTIAGWCLQFAASFPQRSGLTCQVPRSALAWENVYESATRLLASGALNRILPVSYCGVFIDEYQDCTTTQHRVALGLAGHLPVCIFGDPLQAIFDFKGQRPVNWDSEVYPAFSKVATLNEPWRWKLATNLELAEWLSSIRQKLEAGEAQIDLRDRPHCVRWGRLPTTGTSRIHAIYSTCTGAIPSADGETLVVIADAANLNSRTRLARTLAHRGFSNIEAVACPTLREAGADLESNDGIARVRAVAEFAQQCMTQTSAKDFVKAVEARKAGRTWGATAFGRLVDLGLAVAAEEEPRSMLQLLDGFRERSGAKVYRRERLAAMRSALRFVCEHPTVAVAEAIAEVQTRSSHMGKLIPSRAIGSTLLVKGLEFDHAVVVKAGKMTRRDWYVALTRASRSLHILSEDEVMQVGPERG